MFQKLTKNQYGNFSRYANKINPNFFISNSPIEKKVNNIMSHSTQNYLTRSKSNFMFSVLFQNSF